MALSPNRNDGGFSLGLDGVNFRLYSIFIDAQVFPHPLFGGGGRSVLSAGIRSNAPQAAIWRSHPASASHEPHPASPLHIWGRTKRWVVRDVHVPKNHSGAPALSAGAADGSTCPPCSAESPNRAALD